MNTRRDQLRAEADCLRKTNEEDPDAWYVGRTDIQSYTADGTPEHYAYGSGPIRVRFLADDGDEALEAALLFCKRMAIDPVIDLETVK